MNKLFEHIGNLITSMSAVILVLVMTILGLITFTHTLFNEVLPVTMTGWERELASWLLALGWEFTLLITTCNTQHLNRKIPAFVAIASGVIVLFFIHAFDAGQPDIELYKRWFIGLLISAINYIFTELFYSKWKELQTNKSLSARVGDLEISLTAKVNELTEATTELDQSNQTIEKLTKQLTELSEYKRREIEKVTCPHCLQVFETIYKLTSHKGACLSNPNKGRKASAFDDVPGRIRMMK
jgi:uncharacterized membrane protein